MNGAKTDVIHSGERALINMSDRTTVGKMKANLTSSGKSTKSWDIPTRTFWLSQHVARCRSVWCSVLYFHLRANASGHLSITFNRIVCPHVYESIRSKLVFRPSAFSCLLLWLASRPSPYFSLHVQRYLFLWYNILCLAFTSTALIALLRTENAAVISQPELEHVQSKTSRRK